MVICFDMRAILTSFGRGIGNYTIGLLNAMFLQYSAIQYILLNWVEQSVYDFLKIPEGRHVIEIQGGDARSLQDTRLVIKKICEQYHPDVFWTTVPVVHGYPTYEKSWFPNVMLVATVHDLIEYIYSDYYFPEFNSYYDYIKKLDSIRKYDLLFSDSQCTRNDFIELLNVDRDKIYNIYMDGNSCGKQLYQSTAHNLYNTVVGKNIYFVYLVFL